MPMWQDIILAIGFALAVMHFGGLDASKIARVIKGYGIRNAVLIGVSITVTLSAIYVGFYLPLRAGSFSNTLWFSMVLVGLCLFLWGSILRPYRPKFIKRVSPVFVYGFWPVVVVVLFIQSDNPIYTLLFFVGGGIGGFATGRFARYIQKRHKEKTEGD